MCGITGTYYFDPARPVDSVLLRDMTNEIRHRGPDDEGYYVRGNIGLGFRRLAIIDLSKAGNQPMSNEDKSLWIIFNGEFYGFQEYQKALMSAGHEFKSRTDTETIVHLYEKEGIDCLRNVDGMFAFALWDEKRRELFLVRDRLGIKPLFYYADKDRIVFASEMKAILKDPAVPREINLEALHHYLTFMTVPCPQTIYKNIFKLPPGHYLHVKNENYRLVQYWDIPHPTEDHLREEDLAQKLEELLAGAVQTQLVSDVPLGAFLSGGVDSSGVVAMMSKALHKDVKTFSINFSGLDEYDESRYARQVSSLFQTDHREFSVTPHLIDILPKLVWHFDEPFAVSSAFATYFLAQLAREHVTVALTGDGGDELFAGYPFRYSMDQRFSRVSWIPLPLRRLVFGGLQRTPVVGPRRLRDFASKIRTYASFFTRDVDHAFFRTFTFFEEHEKKNLYEKADTRSVGSASIEVLNRHYRMWNGLDPVNRRLYADMKTTLVDEMLTKVDRMTMAWSLEARVPLLDHRLVEFIASVPGKLKIRGREGKLLLKKALKPYLPAEILSRKKHGFNVPMDRWLRNELNEFMRDLLAEETVKRRGFFNPNVVQGLMADHEQHKANNVGQLYILMNFEIWYRTFLQRAA